MMLWTFYRLHVYFRSVTVHLQNFVDMDCIAFFHDFSMLRTASYYEGSVDWDFPPASLLDGINGDVPYFFVGDDAVS